MSGIFKNLFVLGEQCHFMVSGGGDENAINWVRVKVSGKSVSFQ